MEQDVLIGVIAVVVLLAIVGIVLATRKRHSDHLKGRFGDEYERTVEIAGSRPKAEAALAEREKRVDSLDIRPLSTAEHRRFDEEWREVKALFVDSPVEAVLHADRMIAVMMKTVGYPMSDFDRRYEDLTVNHADVAKHYRQGHSVIEGHNRGNASTEDMRRAMKDYEALFEHLVADAEHAPSPDPAQPLEGQPATISRTVDRDRDQETQALPTGSDDDRVRERPPIA